MIRNGRPYTCEAGFVDDKLITDDLKHYEIKQIGDWIKENVISSKKVYDQSSYSLKHILQHDIELYLTNNQFKDAMLLAGYEPVDPDQLNWHFKIILRRDINNNPNPFVSWAKYKSDTLPEFDFIVDMMNDKEFPIFGDHHIIIEYLTENASDVAIESFQNLWRKYTEESDIKLNSFVEWLRDHIHDNNPIGTFAVDVVYAWDQGEFPSIPNYDRIRAYLEKFSTSDELKLFEDLWSKYDKEMVDSHIN